MNIFKRLRLFFVFHSGDYKKLLSLTSLDKYSRVNESHASDLKYQGYSAFFTKNFRHAQMCFEILKDKSKCSSKDFNFLAYIYARHNEKDKAIQTWCLALEKNKFSSISKKALDYIRNKGRDINLIDDEYFDTLIPAEPFIIPLKKMALTFLILLLAGALFLAGYFGYFKISDYLKYQKYKNDPTLNNIFLPYFNTNLLEKPKEKNDKYSFNENEIKQKFEKIKTDIINKRVVEAQIGINQIKLSNASQKVKIKTEMLEKFIDEPDYANFKNIISFDDFLKDRELYNNIYIIWDGRVVNVRIQNDKIVFNLVLGDEKKGIVRGIIPVIFKKAVIVNNNDMVKVFGKVNLDKNELSIEGRYLIENN